MLTNLIATLIVVVATNTYAPKQYLDNSYGCLVYGCKEDHSRWLDSPDGIPFWGNSFIGQESRTRDNPDVRVTEVREVRSITFDCEGKTWCVEVSNAILSTKRSRRIVTTDELWTDE